MNILKTIKSWWSIIIPDPALLDHIPVARKRKQDWRINAVMKASERHGKPFKVAMRGVPREVMKDGSFQVVGQSVAAVVQIKRGRK